MDSSYLPAGYKPLLDIRQTQVAIKKVKDFFERDLAIQLNLTRVSAPLFVRSDSGLNDTLNGVERPVAFDIKDMNCDVEIVQSLAKWKRRALKDYGFKPGEGLYADMNAIRRDEDTDNIHSVFVDQWDWEKIITPEQRNVDSLKRAVRAIYRSLRHTETYIAEEYDIVSKFLPDEIYFITTQELEDMYPDLTPKQRENEIARDKGAVFIMQIGGKLRSGEIHDDARPTMTTGVSTAISSYIILCSIWHMSCRAWAFASMPSRWPLSSRREAAPNAQSSRSSATCSTAIFR